MQVRRLLVSLDGRQIESLARPAEQERWRGFLNQTVGNGIPVELLLGEPLWILPRYRQNLLSILYDLERLPFTGVHLDLEPNQLDPKEYNSDYLLAQLLRTLQAVIEVSPWPVGISLHPRYLDESSTGICLGCALGNLRLAEVSLMMYVADPNRAAQRLEPLLDRYPQLAFTLAQSVEPILSDKESYFTAGRQGFHTQMRHLRESLSGSGLKGINIQSYSDYLSMTP